MAPATEYYGLIDKNGAWILSDRARRHPQMYHSIFRVACSTLHLVGCFGSRLSIGKRYLSGMSCAENRFL
eukprot:12931672-Prorocentrum_lima.AAC.1